MELILRRLPTRTTKADQAMRLASSARVWSCAGYQVVVLGGVGVLLGGVVCLPPGGDEWFCYHDRLSIAGNCRSRKASQAVILGSEYQFFQAESWFNMAFWCLGALAFWVVLAFQCCCGIWFYFGVVSPVYCLGVSVLIVMVFRFGSVYVMVVIAVVRFHFPFVAEVMFERMGLWLCGVCSKMHTVRSKCRHGKCSDFVPLPYCGDGVVRGLRTVKSLPPKCRVGFSRVLKWAVDKSMPGGSLQLVRVALAEPSPSWSNIDEENLDLGERNVK
ncbi:hypothetical protein Tco_0890139 [Tanacetum coccineum]